MIIRNALRKISRLGMVTYMLLLSSVLLPIYGCGTTIVRPYDGPCPLRPELEPIHVDLQIEIAPHTLRIIADNQLKLKKHIVDLEDLSGCTK